MSMWSQITYIDLLFYIQLIVLYATNCKLFFCRILTWKCVSGENFKFWAKLLRYIACAMQIQNVVFPFVFKKYNTYIYVVLSPAY